MSNLQYFFIFSVSAVTIGCYHARIVATSNVRDCGAEIHTRHRYRLIFNGKDGEDKWGTRLQQFQIYQSAVFDDDGIPVVISVRDGIKDEKGHWTQYLMGCSSGILPWVWMNHIHRYCDISTAKQKIASIEICGRMDAAVAFWPLPVLMFFWDGSSCSPNAYEFKGHKYSKLGEFWGLDDMAMAHGIASRLKEAEDVGKINERFAVTARTVQSLSDISATRVKVRADDIVQHGFPVKQIETSVGVPFEIERCASTPGKDFAYVFTLRKHGEGGMAFSDYSLIRNGLRSAIRSHYASLHPAINPRTLVVDFTEYELNGDVVTGRVAVLAIQPVYVTYDSTSRTGIIGLRVGDGQFEDARRWIRRNLAALARRSDIASDGDAVPQGSARFYSQSEVMSDGVLKVSFKTE